MKKEKIDYLNRLKSSLVSPLVILILIVMILNDQFLKGSGLISSVITGKLSDFAFLFAAPIVLGFIIRANSLNKILLAYFIPAVLFILMNTNAVFAGYFDSIMTKIAFGMRTWPDLTDLVALVILPVSFYYVISKKLIHSFYHKKKIYEYALVIIACTAFLATSQPRYIENTHEPIYMGWVELRSSVRVEKPRPVLERGKIYVKGHMLFVNEPNEGIHVFDNSNKKKPVAKAFIKIPGNVDIAVKNNVLYADSFVDLLVFRLSIKSEEIKLVKRIEDVFEYNGYQIKPSDARFYYSGPFMKLIGVVIGWKRVR